MIDKIEKINFGKPAREFFLEAARSPRGMIITIGGIVGINNYTDECVSLKSHGCKLNIAGKHLCVSIFENKNIEISGKVMDISFAYGKN